MSRNHTRARGISNGETDPDEEDAALPRDGHGLGDGGDDGLAAGHQHGAAHPRVHEVLLNENEATEHEAVRNNSKSRIANFSMKRKAPVKKTCMSMTSMAVSLHLVAAAMDRRDLGVPVGILGPEKRRFLR